MPETRIGKLMHKLLERVLKGEHLEQVREEIEPELVGEIELRRFQLLLPSVPLYVERIKKFKNQKHVSRQLVEYTLGVREDGASTAFYSKDAFFRGVIDVAYLFSDEVALVDHKTGYRSRTAKINEQLEGYAVLAAAQFRRIRKLWLGVHWVADADVEWGEPLSLDYVQRKAWANVLDNIEAAALAAGDGPRPSPGVWCYRCSYRTICPAGHDVRFEPVDELEEFD